MPIEQRFCVNHPQRAAIGICVVTRKPICGECSTRYEGVNYSREGLELLRKQRAEKQRKLRKFSFAALLALLGSPLAADLLFLAHLLAARTLMEMLHSTP
jgi:hypothetical protein